MKIGSHNLQPKNLLRAMNLPKAPIAAVIYYLTKVRDETWKGGSLINSLHAHWEGAKNLNRKKLAQLWSWHKYRTPSFNVHICSRSSLLMGSLETCMIALKLFPIELPLKFDFCHFPYNLAFSRYSLQPPFNFFFIFKGRWFVDLWNDDFIPSTKISLSKTLWR